MKRSQAVVFNLPFLTNCKPTGIPFMSLGRAHTFLGNNFYNRLNSIYTNLLEALIRKNSRYMEANLEKSLAQKVFSEMGEMEAAQHSLRLKMPKVTITSHNKNVSRFKRFQDRVWMNDNTKIGIICRVYFGHKFDRENPIMNKNAFLQVGEFRYLNWDRQKGLLENFSQLYNHQTFEFVVLLSSKIHLKAVGVGEIYKNEIQDEEVVRSQVVLQCGNSEFDWIITDINGLAST